MIPVVNNVVVAPVTSTIRSIPTCISVGPDEGIDHESVATFDNLATVPKSVLTVRLGALGAGGEHRVCAGPCGNGQLLISPEPRHVHFESFGLYTSTMDVSVSNLRSHLSDWLDRVQDWDGCDAALAGRLAISPNPASTTR